MRRILGLSALVTGLMLALTVPAGAQEPIKIGDTKTTNGHE